MKELTLLTWLTQLGMSVALPLIGFPVLGLWLQNQFGWGRWVFWVALCLGLYTAFDGLRSSLKSMERLSRKEKKDKPTAVSFSEHD